MRRPIRFFDTFKRISLLGILCLSLISSPLFIKQRVNADPIYPELISKNNTGEPQSGFIPGGCGGGPMISISADARYVLFCSAALNLNPQRTDQNSSPLYVRDRLTNQTVLVSVNNDGVQENGSLLGGKISGDGRHVMFTTSATNIDPRVNDPSFTGSNQHLVNTYVRDLDLGITTLVSVDSNGTLIRGGGSESISYDGNILVFTGSPSNPLPPFENYGLYVRDIAQNQTTLIAPNNPGGRISSDGNFVIYNKRILPNSTQVTKYNVLDQTSESYFGVDAADAKGISENGRYIVVRDRDGSISNSTSLCPPSFCGRLVRYDTLTSSVSLIDVKDDGTDPSGWYDGDFSSMSPDGRFIAFYGLGSVGFTEDNFSHQGLFVRDLTQGNTVLVSKNKFGQPLDDVGGSDSWFASSETEFIVYDSAGSTNSGFPPRQVLLTKVYAEYELGDEIPPNVSYLLSSQPNSNGWHNSDVTIDWQSTDPAPSSGTPTDPSNTVASAEGANVTYTSAPSCDPAGNCATGSAQLSIDKTAPTVSTPTVPLFKFLNQTVTVSATATDALSGVDGGEFYIDTDPGQGNSTPMTLNGSTLSGSIGTDVSSGFHTVYVRSRDRAGNWSNVTSRFFYVVPFSPPWF